MIFCDWFYLANVLRMLPLWKSKTLTYACMLLAFLRMLASPT